MSSHHSAQYLITHYGQQKAAKERRALQAHIRECQREERAMQWAEYRRELAIRKAQFNFWYWSSAVSLILGGLLTVAAGVVYVLRTL